MGDDDHDGVALRPHVFFHVFPYIRTFLLFLPRVCDMPTELSYSATSMLTRQRPTTTNHRTRRGLEANGLNSSQRQTCFVIGWVWAVDVGPDSRQKGLNNVGKIQSARLFASRACAFKPLKVQMVHMAWHDEAFFAPPQRCRRNVGQWMGVSARTKMWKHRLLHNCRQVGQITR